MTTFCSRSRPSSCRCPDRMHGGTSLCKHTIRPIEGATLPGEVSFSEQIPMPQIYSLESIREVDIFTQRILTRSLLSVVLLSALSVPSDQSLGLIFAFLIALMADEVSLQVAASLAVLRHLLSSLAQMFKTPRTLTRDQVLGQDQTPERETTNTSLLLSFSFSHSMLF
jgi:hypothetical protein